MALVAATAGAGTAQVLPAPGILAPQTTSPLLFGSDSSFSSMKRLETTAETSISQSVGWGAAVGAVAGAALYARDVRDMHDGDFLFPISLIIYMGAGALAGAGVGLLVGWVL